MKSFRAGEPGAQGTQRQELPSVCRGTLALMRRLESPEGVSGAHPEPEEMAALRSHLRNCRACRHSAMTQDPLWAFRLSRTVDELAAMSPTPAGDLEDGVWDVGDLKQRVRGAIRAREVEERSAASNPQTGHQAASSRLARSAWLTAAVVLVFAAGLLQNGRARSLPENEARLRVVSFLESLPVVDAGALHAESIDWREEGDLATDASRDEFVPGAQPVEGVEGAEILAQMSGVVADLVWIVDGSLEI